MNIKIDEEFRQLVPPLTEDEYNNLEQSLLSEGCRDSLVLWDGILIDGHNRYGICKKHGILYKTVEKPFESRTDVKIWMLQNQLGRRNLIPYIKAELALELEDLFKEKAKENTQIAAEITNLKLNAIKNKDNINNLNISGCQNSDNPSDHKYIGSGQNNLYQYPHIKDENALQIEDELKNKLPKIEPIDTKKELAKLAGVSHDTIARVKTIRDKAPEQLKEKVKSGEISINQAYNDVKTTEKLSKKANDGDELAKNILPQIDSGKLSLSQADKVLDIAEKNPDKTDKIIKELPKLIDESLTVKQFEKALIDPHVAYNSGNNEWYTPEKYIHAAYAVMGNIDLDPASSEIANKIVKANKFYSAADDGLTKCWKGKVWMNPPYSSKLISLFCDKLVSHCTSKEVTEAIVLVNNATETEWFNSLVKVASAVVFPTTRIKFWSPDDKITSSPLQGQAVIYMGENIKTFFEHFECFGWGATL